MSFFSLKSLFIILLLFYCKTCSEWISFNQYFRFYDKIVNANVIRPRANCEAGTIQIIPGDCRPIYYKVKTILVYEKSLSCKKMLCMESAC